MKKYKTGNTQGTFDMFHIGHLNLLHQANELCEELIVGVNTDHLVNEYKHKQPVVNERDRAAIEECESGTELETLDLANFKDFVKSL